MTDLKQTAYTTSSYRWFIVLAGMLGLFAALGLGRFSLGMMLPAMGEGLDLTYEKMGMISTANFSGYLAAVLICGYLNNLLGARRLIFMGLLLIGVSMALIGLIASYPVILVLYTLTGIGSALANIPIMALIAVWFAPEIRGRAAGMCVAGNGIGIMFSGRAVPVLNEMGQGYQLSWLVIGGLVVGIATCCLALVRNSPEKERAGHSMKRSAGLFGSVGKRPPAVFYLCGALYFLFGFTYVIYVTFLVTSLVQERGFSEQSAGMLWMVIGMISIISGPLFGYISDRIGRQKGLMLVFALQAVAYLLSSLSGFQPTVYLSAFCFSLVAFSIPTIMAALVGDLAGPQKAAAMFGFVTFIFGFGQIAGPAVAGVIAEQTGSFSGAFLLSSILAGMAVLLCLLLPKNSHSG